MPDGALVVRPGGVIERIPLPSARQIHDTIGDYFSLAFSVRDALERVRLVGYCDDMFLHKPPGERPAWNCALGTTLYREVYPIAGPIVITAVELPETVPMTAKEMAGFRFSQWTVRFTDSDGSVFAVPVLEYLG